MIQYARGWCTGMTQRDCMGKEVGGGVQDAEHVYTCGRFPSKYGKTKTISLTSGAGKTGQPLVNE